MGASECWAYFDYNKISDNYCVLAAVIMDSKTAFTPKYRKIVDAQITEDYNQFSLTILALDNAIELILETNLNCKINLQHQNKTIIDWLSRGYASFAYDGIFSSMYENFKKMYVRNKGEVYLGHINSKQNPAKKYCKTEKSNKVRENQPLHKVVIVDEELEVEINRAEKKEEGKVVNLFKF